MFTRSKNTNRLLPAPFTGALAQHQEFTSSARQQPVSLVTDTSASMAGRHIQAVNRGLGDFMHDCSQDVQACAALQIQLVTFGGTVQVHPFVSLTAFRPAPLVATGFTPLAEALLAAIAGTERHRQVLIRTAEVDVLKPLYFIFSDGQPTSTDSLLEQAAACVRHIEHAHQGAFYAFGVNQAATDGLQPFFPRQVHLLPEGPGSFAAFFRILSASCRSVSRASGYEDRDLTPLIESHLRDSDSENHDA